MRAFTRIVTAGFFVSAVVLTAVPASAATPAGWCKGPSPCTSAAEEVAAPDGWCLIPGTDICRRY
jgi:hypothetical protein